MSCTKQALDVMRSLRHERKADSGICTNMAYLLRCKIGFRGSFSAWNLWAEKVWMQWPEFSGDRNYPVTDPDIVSPLSALAQHHRNSTMWVGEYGAARIRLLEYLIAAAERGE